MNKGRLIRSLVSGVLMTLFTVAFAEQTKPEKESATDEKPVQTEVENSKEATHMQRLPFRGKINKVDLKKGTIILKGKTKTRVFMVTKSTKIQKLGKPAKLTDAKVGEAVGGYAEKTKTPDTYTLISLRLGPKPGSKAESASKKDEEEDEEAQAEKEEEKPVEKS